MAVTSKTGEERVLVIVESPTKARTITKFLPEGFVVKASVGHVRDLPNSATEVPAKYKKQPWGRLGVNVDGEFEPIYVIPKGKKDLVKEMRAAVRKADLIYFATDEDREGESISWHPARPARPENSVQAAGVSRDHQERHTQVARVAAKHQPRLGAGSGNAPDCRPTVRL